MTTASERLPRLLFAANLAIFPIGLGMDNSGFSSEAGVCSDTFAAGITLYCGSRNQRTRICRTVFWLCLAISANVISGVTLSAEPTKHVVLIAGPKSHGPGEHEYLKSVKLLKALLDQAPNVKGVQTEIYFNGWPDDPSALERADTIAILSDGEDRTGTNSFHAPFMTDERMTILQQQMRRGCGFVTFHFSTFAPAQYAQQILDWSGAYFDWQGGHGEGGFFGVKNDGPHQKWHSAIRDMEADVALPTPKHPVSEGVSSFHLKDEFYYQLTFRDHDSRLKPILRVPALSSNSADQVVAWAVERKDGGRGFGTTTGHYFENWRNDDYRKLILNALLWTARGTVPKGGVQSTYLDQEEVDHVLLIRPVSRTTKASYIVSVLQPFVDRHELAGAVTVVASKDKVLSRDAVGYADIAGERRMSTDALFWIASMSKPITSTALMMLVDEGKVRLDDPVEKYLPQFTPRIITVSSDETHVQLQKPQHTITARQLLSHRSGIPYSSSLETPTLDVFPLELRVQSYALEPLMFEPGSDFAYSNAGINAAARIIEVVSGMRYEEFLQRRLFDPMGMRDTTFWPTEAQLARLAKSYKPNASQTDLEETPITQLRYPLTDRAHRYPMPAGGLFSTADDMAIFCQMFLNGGNFAGKRYLSEAAVKEMTRNQGGPVVGLSGNDGYGLGWFTHASGTYGHTGAYSTDMTINPALGLITIWMVQHAGFPGNGDKSEVTFEKAAAEGYSP